MDKVSFTADAIAARRTLMGIPYSDRIYQALLERVKGTSDEAPLHEALESNNLRMVTFFDARYHLLDKLMKQTGAKKVLELAAGMAPRGLNWTDDKNVQYVELDLPRKSADKQHIINVLVADSIVEARPNLHLEAGDVLNREDMIRATSYLALGEPGPIVIANEGLLRYLTFEKKRILAENIKYLLERFGGYWITPDINLPDDSLNRDAGTNAYRQKTQAKLGMDTNQNLFESIPFARNFFEELGFVVEQHSFMEVASTIVSPVQIKMSAEELEKVIGWRVAFVMKLK